MLKDLASLVSWAKCYKNEPKRPIGGPKAKPLTYEEASKAPTCGLLMSDDHDIIVLDVDKVDFDDLPKPIKDLLVSYPTYTEVSYSGNGLHIFYKVDKSQLPGTQIHNVTFPGSLFIRDQFVMVTGNSWSGCDRDYIAELPVEALPLTDRTEKEQEFIDNIPKCTLRDLKQWLQVIPTKATDAVCKAYRQNLQGLDAVDDYTHWLTVGMALAHYGKTTGQVIGAYTLWDEWSQKDPDKYTSPSDTFNKFNTLDSEGITYHTIAKLYHGLTIVWPRPKLVKGKPTNVPLNTELVNFEALFEHYGLTVMENEITKMVKVTGDSHVVEHYFPKEYEDMDVLAYAVLALCQDHKFIGLTVNQVKTYLGYLGSKGLPQYNPICDWVLSKPWDGEDRLSTLLGTVVDPEDDLSRTYITKGLMSIIRSLFYRGRWRATTGIVVLQGAEASRKSTWLRQLLGPFEDYVGESQYDLDRVAVKDLQLEAGQFLVMIYDEAERLMKASNLSKFKNFLVQESDTYRPVYGRKPIKTRRIATFWGTTNETLIASGSTGSRRQMIVPVSWCDTTKQAEMDMQQLYTQLYSVYEATENKPSLWTLSEEEIRLTNERNNAMNLAPDLHYMLQELFDFSAPFHPDMLATLKDNDHLMLLSQVRTLVSVHFDTVVKLNTLRAALTTLCSQWTGTTYKPRAVRGRLITAGRVKPHDRTFWVMPTKCLLKF